MYLRHGVFLCACWTSAAVFAIEPLSESDMEAIDGQVVGLPAFLMIEELPETSAGGRDGVAVGATSVSSVSVSSSTVHREPVPLSGSAVPVAQIESIDDVTGTLGVVLQEDGSVALNATASASVGDIDVAVEDAMSSSVGSMTSALGMDVNGMSLSGVGAESSMSMGVDAKGSVSTTVRSTIDLMQIDRMDFGSNSVLSGYSMYDVQIRNLDTTVSIRH